MPSTCIFELDRKEGIYFSGETITGRVHLRTTSDKQNGGIYIRIHGEAKVRFDDDYSDINYYSDEETYLDVRTSISAGGTLPAGYHTYTISIPIPLACPSTCKLEAGKIRYELSLVIERSYNFNNVFKQPITVKQQLDLNSSPVYMVPLRDHSASQSFFNAMPLLFTFCTSRGGYTPGERIEYQLRVDNQTLKAKTIEHCVTLQQIFTFKARRPSKKLHIKKNRLAEVRGVVFYEKRKITTHTGFLDIPPTPPTCLGTYIISVAYVLKINIEMGLCQPNLKMYLPIVLGTVPITQSFAAPNMPPTNEHALGHDDSADSDKPPRYEDCVKAANF